TRPATPTAVPTRPPTPAVATAPAPAAPARKPGQVLADDDLARGDGAWTGIVVPCAGSAQLICHETRGLRLRLATPGHWLYSPNPLLPRLADVAVDLDVTVLSTPDPTSGSYGVLCRYQDESNYDVLKAWADGTYSIEKAVGGMEYSLADSRDAASPAPPAGAPPTHVHFECAGDTFLISANGQELLSAQDTDPTLSTGATALYACTCRGGAVDVIMSHVTVAVPGAAASPAASPAAGAPTAGVVGTTRRYQDPAGRFSLNVPADWTKSDALSGDNIVAFIAPAADSGFRANVNVILSDVSGDPGLTVEQLARETDAQQRQTFNDYRTISLEPLEIGGRPAYRLIYQVTLGSVALQQEQIFLLDGTTAHVLTFSALSGNFARYASTFDTIAASYRIGP
ncbi:MAG TPA: DcrB-related protein, partial [Thermomicrobiales bacterium]|nr:DcrB-related protein [Thermomicrobiales bacterium]